MCKQVANLGDCGVKLLRGGRVVGATAVQEHAFNMPYQIADPDSFPETDMAADAQLYSFPVQPGDVIVMASDGLWDNLWDEQVREVLLTFVLNTVVRTLSSLPGQTTCDYTVMRHTHICRRLYHQHRQGLDTRGSADSLGSGVCTSVWLLRRCFPLCPRQCP